MPDHSCGGFPFHQLPAERGWAWNHLERLGSSWVSLAMESPPRSDPPAPRGKCCLQFSHLPRWAFRKMPKPWGFNHCRAELLSLLRVQRRFRSSPSFRVTVSLPAPGKSPARGGGEKPCIKMRQKHFTQSNMPAFLFFFFSMGVKVFLHWETCQYNCTDINKSQSLDRSPELLGKTCTRGLWSSSASTTRFSYWMLFHTSHWIIDRRPFYVYVTLYVNTNRNFPYSMFPSGAVGPARAVND